MNELLTYFLLFAVPFLVIPLGFNQFELPKVIALILTIIILLAFYIMLFVKKRNVSISKVKILLIITLLIISFYHLIAANFSLPLLWGNIWRPQGTVIYLGLLIIFVLADKLPFKIKNNSQLATLSLVILFLATLLIGPRESFRFIGPLGEANALGASVIFLFPFGWQHPKYRKLSLVISLILILLSGSRSAILGFSAELIILLLVKLPKVFVWAVTSFLIIFIISIVFPFSHRLIPVSFNIKYESRADIWSTSFQAALNAPLLGTGFGSVQEMIHSQAEKTQSLLRVQSIDHAHNLFLNWWIENGLIGLLILLYIIYRSLQNLIVQKSWTLLSILVGLLIVQIFNPLSIANLIHFWYILGISFTRHQD